MSVKKEHRDVRLTTDENLELSLIKGRRRKHIFFQYQSVFRKNLTGLKKINEGKITPDATNILDGTLNASTTW